MGRVCWSLAGIATVTGLLLARPSEADGARGRLPEAVRQAIEKAFPNAVVRGYGRETERGVRYYEINLVLNGNRIEVEVNKHGGIGEVERRISIEDAPKELAKAIRKVIGQKGRARIERHERWGVARGGRFVKLETPRVFYEVKFYVRGGPREAKWRPQPVALPAKATAAVQAAFPRAVTTHVEKETEGGVEVYEVSLILDGQDVDVIVAAGGEIVEVAAPVALASLPQAARKALKRAAGGARIHRVERRELRAELRDGHVVPLAQPKVTYEAILRKGDQVAEVEASAEGATVEGIEWHKFEPFEDDEDDDDD